MAFSKISAAATIAALASLASAQTPMQIAELNVILEDVKDHINDYISLSMNPNSGISMGNLPKGVLDIGMKIAQGDKSYTTMYDQVDFAGVEQMLTKLPWYSSRLLPEIDAAVPRATSSEPAPVTSSEPAPATSSEPAPVTSSEPAPATSSEAAPVTSSETAPATSSEAPSGTSSKATPASSSEAAKSSFASESAKTSSMVSSSAPASSVSASQASNMSSSATKKSTVTTITTSKAHATSNAVSQLTDGQVQIQTANGAGKLPSGMGACAIVAGAAALLL